MLTVSEKYYRYAAITVLGIVGILILLTFRQYGITWDEELQSQYGLAIVDYYTSLFADRHYKEIYNLYLYGGMFDGFASIFDRFTPFNVYGTRHLLNALFGLLGLWGTWRLGRVTGGGIVGLTALILLALTPSYYGHMFNNPKDIPFAAGVVWSLYYMARCTAELPRIRWNLIFKLGLVFGFTLGVRVGGVMAFLFWMPIILWRVWQLSGDWISSGLMPRVAALVRIGWRLVLPVFVFSYFIMLVCWPWAQENPLLNPFNALIEFEHFPHNVEVLLNGTTYMSTNLPWFYVPVYFGIQLPEFLLGLLAFFIVSKLWIWRGLAVTQKQALALVHMMAFLPPLYAVLGHSALYDGVRHFLFVVPLLCVLAALGLRQLVILLGRLAAATPKSYLRGGLIGAAGFAAVTIASSQIALMTELHPYEYIYANSLAGGVPGAYGRFELDYWGVSFKEAAEHLQDYVAREGGVPQGKIWRIAICGSWDSAMIYLPPDYQPVVANEPAEFFLSTTRWICQNMRPGREIIRVSRQGAPLAIIKDLRGGFETYGPQKH